MGRPLKEIDTEGVIKLARLGCTHEEIADFYGVERTTVTKRFSREIANARSAWKMSLRRAQLYRAVKDRSDSMLIHLGKTYLGQGGSSEGESGDQESVIFECADDAASPGSKPVLPPTETA